MKDAGFGRIVEARIEALYGVRPSEEAVDRLIEHVSSRMDAVGDSVDVLLSADDPEVADIITINETYFFREYAHFALLLRSIIPNLIQKDKPIRVCSCASATGCEAYTLAMVLNQATERHGAFSWEIDAFDLNPSNIELARQGVYGKSAFREDGSKFAYLLGKYAKALENGYAMTEELKATIHFFPHNLMSGMPAGDYDLVFFRNAFIYLTEHARSRVIDSIVESLVPGGVLFVGTSETAAVAHPFLETRFDDEVFYFQKKADDEIATMPSAAAISEAPGEDAIEEGAGQYSKFHGHHARARHEAINMEAIIELVSDERGEAIVDEDFGDIFDEKIDERVNELIARVFFWVHAGDIDQAERYLKRIEARHSHESIFFLKGEIFRYNNDPEKAEYYYRASVHENSRFWPASYRIANLLNDRNDAKRREAMEQTVRAVKRGHSLRYECFIGGFSPDYYLGLLEKRLANIPH